MNDFITLMISIFNFLKIDMNVYGFTFSFWDIFLWGAVVGLVLKLVFGLIGGGDSD